MSQTDVNDNQVRSVDIIHITQKTALLKSWAGRRVIMKYRGNKGNVESHWLKWVCKALHNKSTSLLATTELPPWANTLTEVWTAKQGY